MKKIVLLCAAGMSTSLLVTKMVLAAEKHNLDYDISAYSISKLKEMQKVAGDIPVQVIDMVHYGMIDGEAIVKQISTLL